MTLKSLPLSFWFELLSFLIAFFSIKRLRGSAFVFFVPFLFIVVSGEFMGAYMKHELHLGNGWLYNILSVIQFLFWGIFFAHFLRKDIYRQWSLLLLACFIFYAVINMIFIQGFRNFNHYTLIVGAFLIILQCCFYYYQLFIDIEDIQLFKSPMFWIVTGAFFFFLGTFFYFALYDHLRRIQIRNHSRIFNLIITNLNLFFYSCISIGLTLVSNKNKWKQR